MSISSAVPTVIPVVVSTPVSVALPVPVAVSTPSAALLTILHPLEGQKLPYLNQVFAFGQVAPGATLTFNGLPVTVHPKGGYLTMVPLTPGMSTIHAEVHDRFGAQTITDRHVYVSSGFVMSPIYPLTLEKGSVAPSEDLLLTAGDTLRVSFQGTTGGAAEFTISGLYGAIPMLEVGAGSATARGVYQGSLIIQPTDKFNSSVIEVALKKEAHTLRQKALGHLSVLSPAIPRIGQITDDIVAVRTAAEGGYDFFVYRGMKVQLIGRMNGQWHVRFSRSQTGWIKESAIQELPVGTLVPTSFLTNFTINHVSENTQIRVPLNEMLAWRAEQSLDPTSLTITLFGAIDRTNLIHYDSSDPLLRLVQWKQSGPDTTQLIIHPKFKTWWGYDVRYEGSTLVIEIRAPWKSHDLRGMIIAVDAGHGGLDSGAVGTLGTLEKNTNLAIARVVADTLEKAGAKPFLTRSQDIDVSLLDRTRLAWKAGARLFISIHGNSSGVEENPLWTNGYSVYFYHPQSLGLARAVHNAYMAQLPSLPDHGLYYDDLSVCRMTQMPAILTEQAYLIVPDQEQLLLDPKFHKSIAAAISAGIKHWLAQ